MAVIGEKAPNLKLGKWVQGMDTNFDKEGDNVKLVEVFQVNCPGCFMHSIPEIINIYQKFKGEGLSVMGVATAFEDYDKNTLENLEMLLTTGEVVGDTKQALSQYCILSTSDAADDLLSVDLGGRRIIKKKQRTTTRAN